MAFCLENRLEFLALAWGAHYAGLHYTAASSRLTADELAYIVDDCGARVFVTSPYKEDVIAEVTAATPNVEARFSIGGALPDHAIPEFDVHFHCGKSAGIQNFPGRD
jgi:acyl-CoA synthetase (AMP-forming)/AMP-acid ligase II